MVLIQLQLCVLIETAKPELVEAVEEKQSQILDRLLKKSLHRNQATLQKVRRVHKFFRCCVAVTCSQSTYPQLPHLSLQLENEKALALSFKKRMNDLTALLAIRLV